MDKPAIVTKQERQLLEKCRPPAATNEKKKRIIHRESDEVVFGRRNQ